MQLLSILLLVGGVSCVLACSCVKPHLQETFCHAQFVFMGRVLSSKLVYKKQPLPNDDSFHRRPIHMKYTVRVKKIFKMKDDESVLNKNSTKVVVYSEPYDSLCGVLDLHQRVSYLFPGNFQDGEMWINICSPVVPWPWVTKAQKRYMRGTYSANCECQIVFDPSDDMGCVWSYGDRHSDCYELETACIKDKNSINERCKWHQNSGLRNCRSPKPMEP
ncbi:metalloproteinase inhibitor 2-like [Dreissena polymorpha]|uniref:NTR domain-containing protein n=1 Tax=Dreissena polymorpha TaxID=45954 RepID=A0A9D4K1B9_DREPO|nr:metalloproteinase inhibitor 2-like [Dreissena polymorpha]XP_052284410.1 metalloproteinase inhibitor 2-like [Dreissena polymorpha]XP_052284411.1 metalloproteinase inhibitor 2-like [Dreissena polymorpha]KAH3827883.1 hypothetical protein DPMN_129827 [Dreissena polymorpha]